ncbi:hypothetical protein BpHYR1_022630 [Brachionus plicatilis]|uniref:Uncharacterized protein n=1 Tax=Brachionus plicatilis TaxID=10195 RepID=A0A3M7Q515_BRAPC|nr:hypothetical protein BpHYR1_022630 [Brachionus plicatilis]
MYFGIMSQTQDFLLTPVTTQSIHKKRYKKRSLVHNHSIIVSECENSKLKCCYCTVDNMLGHLETEHALELGYQHNNNYEFGHEDAEDDVLSEPHKKKFKASSGLLDLNLIQLLSQQPCHSQLLKINILPSS